MKVFKYKPVDTASSCTISENELDALTDELKLANIGEKFEVEVAEMSQDDFDKLPEFEGW